MDKSTRIKYGFCIWITVEIFTVVIFLGCILMKIQVGKEFSQTDIIFSVLIIGVAITVLGITVACFVCYKREQANIKGEIGTSCHADRKYNQVLLPIHKKYGSDCAICLQQKSPDSKNVVQLTCNHDYHDKCIKTCFVQSRVLRCPTCRQTPDMVPFPVRFSAYLSVLLAKFHQNGKKKEHDVENIQKDAVEVSNESIL